MQYTTNHSLKKPETTDNVNIADLNYNADLLDGMIPAAASSSNQVADKNYVQTGFLAKPTAETYTIAVADWSSMSGNEPFAYSTEITATHTIGTDTVCELINNNAVNFAKYGFAIGEVAGQNLELFALTLPSASVTLEVDYYG